MMGIIQVYIVPHPLQLLPMQCSTYSESNTTSHVSPTTNIDALEIGTFGCRSNCIVKYVSKYKTNLLINAVMANKT